MIDQDLDASSLPMMTISSTSKTNIIIQVFVFLTASYTMRNYCLIEFVKPGTWRLFEAINRFLEMTHTLPFGLKPRWSSHINSLSKITICLSETFGHKTSLQAINNTIRILFNCKNLTTTNNSGSCRFRN